MPSTTKVDTAYTIRAEDPDRRGMTGSADEMQDAVEAAWHLQRYLEAPVEIVDHRDDPAGRVIGRLHLEWID